jgi:5-formyltetrahydrofolate cyclo-ligase
MWQGTSMNDEKQELRRTLRTVRRDHVAALDERTRALLFLRPPRPLLEAVVPLASIGLYNVMPHEAPVSGYARYFAEQGHLLALPRFAHRGALMEFARFSDVFDETDLETGPFGLLQPSAGAQAVEPDVLFVPLLGFTTSGHRIGQGGGHYDRYLAARPHVTAIGLAWDAQLIDDLPVEEHDVRLDYVVTPTRLYGPF